MISKTCFPIQGKDLAARDANGLSDPYVRITLLPDKKVSDQSRQRKKGQKLMNILVVLILVICYSDDLDIG